MKGLLSGPLTITCVCQWCQLSKLLYNIVADVLANLIHADKRTKGIQIRDQDIKIVNAIDNTTIFLRDIICLNRIQVIVRLCKKDKLFQR